jgi:selT/selW/selH-like putative selenoprotein
LEAALRREPGLSVEAIVLIQGDRGIFEVRAGEDLIFSKRAAGRFPTNAEVIAILRARGPERPAS